MSGKGSAAEPAGRNEVLLVGRVSGEVVERELPSGDVLVSWRVVVPRPERRGDGGRRAVSVDTIDCATFAAGVRRTVLGWAEGDVVEVTGALRRRFWASAAGRTSRTEVEVARGRRLSRRAAAAAPSAASA